MTFPTLLPAQLLTYVAAGAAALIVLAYVLKMRRRRFEVPFSSLWQRVLEQRDATSLWKQLKRWLSLLLALALAAALLFAALDPTLGGIPKDARSVVVLIDASASMRTNDGDDGATRLDAAKARATALVDSMGGGDVAMIVKVDGQATPLSRFSSDAPRLRQVIETITPSDAPADLTRALGAAADALRDRRNPLIVLVSDGAYGDAELAAVRWAPSAPAAPAAPAPGDGSAAGAPAVAAASNTWQDTNLADVDLTGIDVRYLPVGSRSDNVGIVAFNVRRYLANKQAYEVLIEVQNFGAGPARRQLALYNGNTAVDLKAITLAPNQKLRQIYKDLPGGDDSRLRAVLRPDPDAPEEGADAFALDDEAFALLPARRTQKVLLVVPPTPCPPPAAGAPASPCQTSDGNLFVMAALLMYDAVDPSMVTPAEYEADPDLASQFDVVIFDEYTPAVLPPPPTSLIYFHPTGPSSPLQVRGTVNKPRVTEIDEDHPVMRWVGLSDVYIDQSNSFAIDRARGELALAYSVRDPIIAARREAGRKILAFGFSLPGPGRASATDLPLRVAFPMLLANAVDWFAGDDADLITTYATGKRQRIPLDGVVGATEAEVEGPRGPDGPLGKAPIVDGVATFYTQEAGFHRLRVRAAGEGGAPGAVIAELDVAANLTAVTESDIAPSATLALGGRELAAPEAFAITRTHKLWLYVLLVVLGLLLLEWATYHRRITL